MLVIDPGGVIRRQIEDALAGCGIRIRAATTGAEALEYARRDRLALVVSVLELPDMSCGAVVDDLRRVGVEASVIFVGSAPIEARLGDTAARAADDATERASDAASLLSAPIARVLHRVLTRRIDTREGDEASCPVGERWARYVQTACVSGDCDPKTLALWGKCAGVGSSQLRETCRILGVRPEDARDLTRVLRAILASARENAPADVFLDISDRRTLQRLVRRSGMDFVAERISAHDYLRHQRFITPSNPGMVALIALLQECEAPAEDQQRARFA